MSEHTFQIEGGDYDGAGRASRRLKDRLKRIGADPRVIRRAMIAAYEAEMNVVIHARRGMMRTALDEGRLDIEVSDEGPGIGDIAQALKEGFSTASPRARELGFGAGMGLPNIRRSSDRFTLDSTPGRGTCLRFTIYLRPGEGAETARNSLGVVAERCVHCHRCLFACPTRAVRVREGAGPRVLDYLCVDCARCVAVCPAGALDVAGAAARLDSDGPNGDSPASSRTVLAVPAALLAQFGPAGPADVLDALRRMGFAEVVVTDSAERAVRRAALDHAAAAPPEARPVIAPTCPAAVNLIATRFGSLIDNLAPLLSPIEAVGEELSGRRAVFVVLCPAQATAVQSGRGPARADLLTPAALTAAVLPLLRSAPERGAESPAAVAETQALPPDPDRGVLCVCGMRQVIAVLEGIENGTVREPAVIEPMACEDGCFGSPLLREPPSLARWRWRLASGPDGLLAGASLANGQGRAIARPSPVRARSGLRLDASMSAAIAKLGRIDALRRSLPGRDCGECGCPTCAALAEDVVRGRVESPRAVCPHLSKGTEVDT